MNLTRVLTLTLEGGPKMPPSHYFSRITGEPFEAELYDEIWLHLTELISASIGEYIFDIGLIDSAYRQCPKSQGARCQNDTQEG